LQKHRETHFLRIGLEHHIGYSGQILPFALRFAPKSLHLYDRSLRVYRTIMQ